MTEDLKNILIKGASELGVALGEGEISAFSLYLRELLAWNKKINLTAIDSDREIVIKHFIDSITPCRFIEDGKKLLDIGAGGGFPGIPLKIVKPGLSVTLIDSVEKKVFFMRHVIRVLGLAGIEAVAGRVEDKAILNKHGGTFDYVTSRAFAELKDFLRLALPYLAPGGSVIAIKGPAYREEIRAVGEIKELSPPEVHEIPLPFSDRVNAVVIYRKIN